MNPDAKKFLIIGGVAVVIVIAGIFLMRSSATPGTVTTGDKSLIRADSNQTHPNAKVAVVEFGDYECPACGEAYPIVKQVLAGYGDKVNFVFRNFPLPQHNTAMDGAEAAEAAGAQGKYWEMHDWLYEHQSTWVEQPNDLDILAGAAQQLGLNVDQFKADIQGRKYEAKIKTDQSAGDALGINATPTFYIDGQQFVGVPQASDLKAKIDAALAKK
jgi:protein-disulfide isomerase